MSALPVEPAPPFTARRTDHLVGLARSYGPLRAVTAPQAPIVRAAAEHDRSVLPRWQRYGDGIHEWAEPRHYTRGRIWVRSTGLVADIHGRRQYRSETYTGRPHVNWRTRDHWLDVVVALALDLRPEALSTHRGNVTPDRFLQWCRTVSLHAHARTGRRCIVRVDRLAELMGCSKSTVQRCQAAAETLGLYVVMSPGRMLTEAEKYDAYNRGSYQRGMANEAALVIPDWLPREPLGLPSPTSSPRSHDTPTSGRYRKSSNFLSLVPSADDEQRSAGKNEPPPQAPAAQPGQKGSAEPPQNGRQEPQDAPPGAPRRVYDPQALQLARDLTEALPWLRATAPGRLECALRRFTSCRLPWTAVDVVGAIDQANARLGRASMTHTLVKNPPALLAKYLRDFDADADHPRFGMDPDPVRPAPISEKRRRNLELLAIRRESGSTPATPETRAAALARIRDELAAQRHNQDD